ncbi:SLAM family member 5-like [Cyprinus carpio]|uniref:SLAM family member 5-like n=1 Tax=Cyprinus carpio TaxID=7962 RepID=A0A9R0AUM8_CYPCA|nr:SLAM family member 5-like [Cyprinus carpio]
MFKLLKKMLHLIFFQLCLWCLVGVSGVDEVKSVMEGDSVTLHIQRDDEIEWRFGPNKILLAEVKQNNILKFYDDSAGGRFKGRLNLDQTGSLYITNTSTTDSGLYHVYSTKTSTLLYTFSLGVYAPVPVPVFMRDSLQYSSSSERSSKCLLLCSVFNVSAVTLSWYKGNSLLSSISESDLSISLSLPLEVEYQDNNTYSCLVNNPISNQTQHLDISQICSDCRCCGSPEAVIRLVLAVLLGMLVGVILAFLVYGCRTRNLQRKKNVRKRAMDRDLTYADVLE